MTRLTDVEGTIIHETDGAWLLKFDADKDPVWIPKSVGEEYPGGITMPEKWAIEKGIV